MSTIKTVTDAIARSASHNEIVSMPYTAERAAELRVACDDWTDAGSGNYEYWGTSAGGEWRVHLDVEQSDHGEEVEECLYCGRESAPLPEVPHADDDAAWRDLAPHHAATCEWIATRAHRR